MTNDLLAQERRSDILRELANKQKVFVTDLCAKYHVSEVTIRKDLHELENRKLLLRIHGGAMRIIRNNIDNEVSIDRKQLYNFKEKKAIGKLASSLIKEDDTIILDSGTTTLEIAKNLHAFRNLTIITNALNIAIELLKYKRFNIFLLGGQVRDLSQSTVGPIAESTLKNFYYDKLFLGVDSISIEKGISTPNIEEAFINQTMMSIAKETIAVFDSSKFNKRSFAFIAPVTQIHAIVTDNKIPSNIKIQLKNMNIKVYIADNDI
jgi:DeoR/GlpR family transcriptional regulator of sugar metabolism